MPLQKHEQKHPMRGQANYDILYQIYTSVRKEELLFCPNMGRGSLHDIFSTNKITQIFPESKLKKKKNHQNRMTNFRES